SCHSLLLLWPACACGDIRSFPTRRSSDLALGWPASQSFLHWFSTPDREQSRPLSTALAETGPSHWRASRSRAGPQGKESPSMTRSEEHTSELQSRFDLVCRLLLEKKYT